MEIQHTDLSLEVYKRLKAMILANEFKPGEKLGQEQIAQMFGVSRMPLHKAFQMLENEMLVENLPRRGFFVTEIDNQRLLDAFECREALEGIAVRRATKVITKKELLSLKALFKPFIGKKKIDVKKYTEADQEFHNSILRISGNQVLQKFEIVKNITSQTYRGGLIRGPEETLPEHLAIIDAIEKGDSKLAEDLMRQHSVKTEILIKKQMEDKD
ncbi:MAG: GntR family transcriptional regulator [Draconibacterium sp.]|nr:GntR family transcriptional regulator [Draconibacterium sp.]